MHFPANLNLENPLSQELNFSPGFIKEKFLLSFNTYSTTSSSSY